MQVTFDDWWVCSGMYPLTLFSQIIGCKNLSFNDKVQVGRRPTVEFLRKKKSTILYFKNLQEELYNANAAEDLVQPLSFNVQCIDIYDYLVANCKYLFSAKDSCNYCQISSANCKRGLSKPTRHCVGWQICHQDTVFSVFPQSQLELPPATSSCCIVSAMLVVREQAGSYNSLTWYWAYIWRMAAVLVYWQKQKGLEKHRKSDAIGC